MLENPADTALGRREIRHAAVFTDLMARTPQKYAKTTQIFSAQRLAATKLCGNMWNMAAKSTSLDQNRNRFAVVHRELLEADLNPTTKMICASLFLEPSDSITGLAKRLRIHRSTASIHIARLEKAGWAKIVGNRIYPRHPDKLRRQKAELFVKHLPLQVYVGEHIFFTWLDELIDSDDFINHARPPFLRNPATGQAMEYDRYYCGLKKAFEHQGPQHFGPTKKFPDAQKAREQELRDWAKLGISSANQIHLIAITWKDLSLQRMLAKIPAEVPCKLIDPKDPFISCLEEESLKYCKSIEKLRS